MNFSSASLFLWIALGVLRQGAPGQAADTCILTDNSCQCAPVTKTGTCLRSVGNGMCLLGQCSEGYKCDCFGFELCSLSPCGANVPVGGEIPKKENVAFPCKMESTAGQCTTFVDVLDSLTAADNSASHASATFGDVLANGIKATKSLLAIQEEKLAVHQMLTEMEHVAQSMSDDDMSHVDVEARAVGKAMREAAVVVERIVEDAKLGSEALMETRKHRRIAHKVSILEGNRLSLLEEEAKKEEKNDRLIEALKLEIEQLNEMKKFSAKHSGLKAKEAAKHVRSIESNITQVSEARDIAKIATSHIFQIYRQSVSAGDDSGQSNA